MENNILAPEPWSRSPKLFNSWVSYILSVCSICFPSDGNCTTYEDPYKASVEQLDKKG